MQMSSVTGSSIRQSSSLVSYISRPYTHLATRSKRFNTVGLDHVLTLSLYAYTGSFDADPKRFRMIAGLRLRGYRRLLASYGCSLRAGRVYLCGGRRSSVLNPHTILALILVDAYPTGSSSLSATGCCSERWSMHSSNQIIFPRWLSSLYSR